jgi:AhpD family alkylhydroperoxidase
MRRQSATSTGQAHRYELRSHRLRISYRRAGWYCCREEKGIVIMASEVYPPATREIGDRRRELAPEIHRAFDAFSKQVFADGALPGKTKQLIAVAAAHVTQCPYCIRGHTRLARRAGASDQEIMEAIWVAAEMRAGGAFAHSTVALHALDDERR